MGEESPSPSSANSKRRRGAGGKSRARGKPQGAKRSHRAARKSSRSKSDAQADPTEVDEGSSDAEPGGGFADPISDASTEASPVKKKNKTPQPAISSVKKVGSSSRAQDPSQPPPDANAALAPVLVTLAAAIKALADQASNLPPPPPPPKTPPPGDDELVVLERMRKKMAVINAINKDAGNLSAADAFNYQAGLIQDQRNLSLVYANMLIGGTIEDSINTTSSWQNTTSTGSAPKRGNRGTWAFCPYCVSSLEGLDTHAVGCPSCGKRLAGPDK